MAVIFNCVSLLILSNNWIKPNCSFLCLIAFFCFSFFYFVAVTAWVFYSIYFANRFCNPPVCLFSSQNTGLKKCVPSKIKLRYENKFIGRGKFVENFAGIYSVSLLGGESVVPTLLKTLGSCCGCCWLDLRLLFFWSGAEPGPISVVRRLWLVARVHVESQCREDWRPILWLPFIFASCPEADSWCKWYW